MLTRNGTDDIRIVPGSPLIQVARFTTDHLKPQNRYEAWYSRDWPRMRPIYRTEPIEPFDTRWEMAQLGPVTFVYSEITAMRWERRIQDIRESDFDPIVVNMMIEGRAYGDMDGRVFDEPAGTFHFHDLARPSLHTSTASRTYGLVLPRPVAEQWFAPLDDLHGLVVNGEPARLLFAFADRLRAGLSELTIGQADRLGQVFLELLGVAMDGARPKVTSSSDALRRRAVQAIEARLRDRDISVDDLCRLLNVSRSRLFKMFQPDGGVKAYILTERLTRARAALGETKRAEPIGAVAHRLGFSDASHLSRAFRQRFGMTPSEYRLLIADNEKRQAAMAGGTLVQE